MSECVWVFTRGRAPLPPHSSVCNHRNNAQVNEVQELIDQVQAVNDKLRAYTQDLKDQLAKVGVGVCVCVCVCVCRRVCRCVCVHERMCVNGFAPGCARPQDSLARQKTDDVGSPFPSACTRSRIEVLPSPQTHTHARTHPSNLSLFSHRNSGHGHGHRRDTRGGRAR